MNSIALGPGVLAAIRGHCESGYPSECCGFLIGRSPDVGGERRIERTVRAANATAEDPRRRYTISPNELLAVEQSLEKSGESVLGFYHSHPDHPALPSEFDRAHAWPWYAYLVLAVHEGRYEKLGAFMLSESTGSFEPVPWASDSGGPSDGPTVTETVSTVVRSSTGTGSR